MTHPPSIQTKNKKEKGEIRRGEESQNKKRWERRCVEVKRREGQGERERESQEETKKEKGGGTSASALLVAERENCKR